MSLDVIPDLFRDQWAQELSRKVWVTKPKGIFMNLNKLFAFMFALISCVFVACSNSEVAGGSSDDAGIYAVKDLDVAGVSQKGPFATGSIVSVQGVDCKTLELTDEKFTGNVKSDKGDFAIDGVNLKSSCALFEVTGYYLNEVTGKESSDKLSLKALTDLSDRKTVNVNLLTHLEYERVKHLVTEKEMAFVEAKKQAEKEVLATFGAAGVADKVSEFESLNIFESGDGNAALLAVSVLMQGDANVIGLTELLEMFNIVFAKNGMWSNDVMEKIAEWASTAKENGQLEVIRKNIKNWNYTDEIPAFEKYVEDFAENYEFLSSVYNGFRIDWSIPKEAYFNPKIKYDSFVDNRDGQVYKTVKIGNQVWMAENLNYADSVRTPSLLGRSWCFGNTSENCAVAGRLYTWAAAIDSVNIATDKNDPQNCGFGKICTLSNNVRGICPEGYHLPDSTEWHTLIATAGGEDVAGKILKSRIGWYGEEVTWNGSDDYGFSANPIGFMYRNESFTEDRRFAEFWGMTEEVGDERFAMILDLFLSTADISSSIKDSGNFVRCIKN